MLGVARPFVADGVSVESRSHESGGQRLVLRADRDLVGFATGRFARSRCGVSWERAAWPHDIEFLGFAFTQFALPVTAGRDLSFDFAPAPGLRSPAAMIPLIARSSGRITLLAPIDHFHEQVLSVTEHGLTWGWHGDLDRVPAGFQASLGIYESASVTDALASWRADLSPCGDRVAENALSTHLSYWTDNGAAYWYRTEPGRTIVESVTDVVESLRSDDVPIRAVELDSWFYDHAVARPIAEVGYPTEVPPTGMLRWEPRADAFAPESEDGIAELARRLDSPLVLHARHIAPNSPYITSAEDWWVDEHAAQPKNPAFFLRWFDDAKRWGATVIEQDWMQVYWFAVRELRAVPGRAAAWQRALNDHARATGVDLVWCMATPADLMLAGQLDRVIAARTCDDYRFNDDPAFLWTWFLVVNRLADTFGLPVFKDCFFSNDSVDDHDDAIDGDRHAELEAALAALSGGPVGIGDRLDRTNREVAMRCCDADGRLRRVDGPIAAVDQCLFGDPARGHGAMWATTTATTADGVWTYVVAINTSTARSPVVDRFELANESLVYDWRARNSLHLTSIEVELEPMGWALFIVSPPGALSADLVGDPDSYVTVEAD